MAPLNVVYATAQKKLMKNEKILKDLAEINKKRMQ